MPISLSLIDFAQKYLPEDQNDSASSADSIENEVVPNVGFESYVSRAAHSALIMRPIYELEARRFGQPGEEETAVGEGVDLMWTAFAILDVISELTEYQVGATRAEVIGRILPLLRNQVAACRLSVTDGVLEDVLGKVFDHLANRAHRYLPFSYTYFDGPTGSYRERRFWLMKTVFTGEGREALFALTDEGYAAYFGLHETSALDATSIGNLRIKLLIDRGNLDDAISVAESNRKQCARKAQQVRRVRRLIRRNIQAVAYDRVQNLAEEGVNQVMDIQKEGSRLHNLVIENLLGSGSGRREVKLHRLAEQLEILNHHLMRLAGELQDLPEDYQHVSHKLFRRRGTGAFPHMDEVMGRIFRLEAKDGARIGREFIARIDPPARRTLFDPAAVIEACDRALERQNVTGDRNQAVLEVDGEPVSRYQPALSDGLMADAWAMLQTEVASHGETSASDLLKNAARIREDDLFPVALAMGLFQSLVDRRVAEKYQLRVGRRTPEERITVEIGGGRIYHGHELVVMKRSAKGDGDH